MTPWNQVYDPLGSILLSALVAALPVATMLVALAFLETLRVDLMAYLFGDILSVTDGDLMAIYGGGAKARASPHTLPGFRAVAGMRPRGRTAGVARGGSSPPRATLTRRDAF